MQPFVNIKNLPQSSKTNTPIVIDIETNIKKSELSVILVSPDGKSVPLIKAQGGDNDKDEKEVRNLEVSFTPKFPGKVGIQILKKDEIIESASVNVIQQPFA